MKSIVGVLTGDLVGSDQLDSEALEAAFSRLDATHAEIELDDPDLAIGSIDRFRGDSWQACFRRPAMVVTTSVKLYCGLMAGSPQGGKTWQTRIGIGIGAANRLDREKISRSSGNAFKASGGALDALSQDWPNSLVPARLLKIESGGPAGTSLHRQVEILDQTTLPLLSLWLDSLSQPECVAIYGTMRGETQASIAESAFTMRALGRSVTRQSISDSLRRVSWKAIETVLAAIETTLRSAQAE